MSGHHKFSELTKHFTPEDKRRIAEMMAKMLAKMDREIHIEPIVLEWSEWHPLRDVERDARQGGVAVPSKQPGVYEVRLEGQKERLAIGKSKDLRLRIKQGLLREKDGHLEGSKIRATENLENIVVRWAVTDRPAAVEEELLWRHRGQFGELPKYAGFA